MRLRLAPALAALALPFALLAGCGSSSSTSDVASLAPPGSPVFVQGTVKPTGELKANTDAAAQKIGGIANLGEFVVEKLESAERSKGEALDFEKEVEPWLGEKAGVFFEKLEGENLTGMGILVESTDTSATQKFVEDQGKASKPPYAKKSFEGIEYQAGGPEENAIGVVGDFLVFAEDEKVFQEVVEASNGESLEGEERFSNAISAATDGSLADVYVDIGGLIEESGGEIAPQARGFLQKAGIDPSEATAVASVIPGSEQIEVDLSSDLGGEKAPSGDASSLLGSLPSTSFAAFAAAGFGEQLHEALDSLDAQGIPGTIPPHKLKEGVKQLGIDLEEVVDSLQEGAIYATGESESALGGALVLTAKGDKASEAVERAATLASAFHVGGVSLLGGKTTGFTVHSAELGKKPLVVAAKEGRIAIGYGVPQTLLGLAAPSGHTLADNPTFKEAEETLGDTPISGFVDGAEALKLAEALVPSSNTGFQEATPYLRHIASLAIGSGSEGDRATAKLIVGLK
jgi:hypothetical protein